MNDIDYKVLLKKYIDHVGDCEGSNFIYHINSSMSDVKFSELEIKTLKELDCD